MPKAWHKASHAATWIAARSAGDDWQERHRCTLRSAFFRQAKCAAAIGCTIPRSLSVLSRNASRRYGTSGKQESKHLIVKMTRSTTAIEPCWPGDAKADSPLTWNALWASRLTLTRVRVFRASVFCPAFVLSYFRPFVIPSSLLKKGDRHLTAHRFSRVFASQFGASPLFQQAARSSLKPQVSPALLRLLRVLRGSSARQPFLIIGPHSSSQWHKNSH